MDFKATDIAAFLNGKVIGDGNVKVSNVSKIEEGGPGTLAFLANLKYENHIYNTKASVVLVGKDFVPKGKINATLIEVDDAYQSFAALLDLYMQAKSNTKIGIEDPSFINKTAETGKNIYVGAFAYVGKNAKIGDNVKLFPQVYIGDNVTIGNDCIIYAGAKVYEDCIIGDRCIIHAGAVIGSDGFGFAPQENGSYKKIQQIGNVILEDDVDVGANAAIDCGTMGATIVKHGTKIDNLVQIGHNCEIGENTVIAGQTGLAGSTKVGKNCKFAGQVGIAGHLSIGDNVTLAAQAGIMSSVKDNEVLWLTPSFNHRDALKASVIFKNLPQLRKDLIQLKSDIKALKNNDKVSSK